MLLMLDGYQVESIRNGEDSKAKARLLVEGLQADVWRGLF